MGTQQADAHEIVPGIYLGNFRVASNYTILQTIGITHVLNTAIEHPNYFENKGLIYKHLPLEDSPSEDISQFFEDSYKFIDNAIQTGGKVLVHCHAGISRSTTILASYMIQRYSKSPREILRHIRSIRKIVNPNPGFVGQLIDYYPLKKSYVFSNISEFDEFQ